MPPKKASSTKLQTQGNEDEEDNVWTRHVDEKSFDESFEKGLERQLNENLTAGKNVEE